MQLAKCVHELVIFALYCYMQINQSIKIFNKQLSHCN